MKIQINNFLEDGVEDIFIRDFSFLGFPVFRIYIPNYSTSHYTVCDRILQNYEDGKHIIDSIISGNKNTLSVEERKILQNVFSHKSYIGTWIIRDIKESYLDLFYAFLVKDELGKDRAIKHISIIEEDFSLAIQEEQHMAILNKNVAYRNRIITLFFGEFISEIVKAWREDDSFVALCLLLKKYRIIISAKTDNNADALHVIHRLFKENMLKNIPDQNIIGNYLVVYLVKVKAIQ